MFSTKLLPLLVGITGKKKKTTLLPLQKVQAAKYTQN